MKGYTENVEEGTFVMSLPFGVRCYDFAQDGSSNHDSEGSYMIHESPVTRNFLRPWRTFSEPEEKGRIVIYSHPVFLIETKSRSLSFGYSDSVPGRDSLHRGGS
jgi:hypothetical protein